ncbi:acyltransferase [Arcobacter porcinus]|uniref:acyltransferase n=1 Tax=Arcobacter porcinus TaxID=1935204 RepID=UPI00081D9446|nr:acyltransferase [Arcobacter porcinus]OCL82735.1 putative acetyltransferase [Arcobacter porcinus]
MNWAKIKKVIKGLRLLYQSMGFSISTWYQFLWINFIRKNSFSNFKKIHLIIPTRYCIFDIHPEAKIEIGGLVQIGYSKVKGSKLETRIRLEENTQFSIKDCFTMYAGGDIQVFAGGKLTFEGGPASGCNIHCQIICADSITIGRSTLIGRNVVIRDYDAHYIIDDNFKIKEPINIGEHCWITEGVLISKGVNIGNGSIVGARSWVIKNVPEKTLVAGNPAMPIQRNIEWKV